MTPSMYRFARVAAPWGDYGEVLHHGICWNRGRLDGVLQLERAGPYLPPLSMPSYHEVVVSDSLRQQLASSSLTGWAFLPVAKTRIVRLEWEQWPKGSEPAKFPAGGEPENYVCAANMIRTPRRRSATCGS